MRMKREHFAAVSAEKMMMDAMMTCDSAVAVAFDTLNSNLQTKARTIDPAATQWANAHDPSDSPGAGSSGDGIHAAAPPPNARAAPAYNAAPPPKAAPTASPAELRRQATARRATEAPYPISPVIAERARRSLAPMLWV